MSRERRKKAGVSNKTPVGIGVILPAFLVVVACSATGNNPIVAPVVPTSEVSSFNRVLVAGFATQTDEDLDLGSETVRVVRNQLRARTDRVVLDAELTSLCERMEEGSRLTAGESPRQARIDREQDALLHDDVCWRKLGEQYQNPLIISGKLRFAKVFRSGFMPQNRYVRDDAGNTHLVHERIFEERNGYALDAEFYFIDGGTGETVRRTDFTEEVLYRPEERVPMLSSYFELMGRLLPELLTVVNRVTAQ